MQEDLASIREVVDLSPPEALDSAQAFLTEQGYDVHNRTATTLTVERQSTVSTVEQEDALRLVVMVVPQPEGGVRVKVRGNDLEGLRDRQAQWLEWSESLPKKESEGSPTESTETAEAFTTEAIRSEITPPPNTADADTMQARYCSNCGHQLASDAQFCQSCGKPLHETARVAAPQTQVSVPSPPQP
jgi:hypothetical protein